MLYLVRGVPGSGKTTFAEKLAESLGCPHFEADKFRDEWPGGREAFPWTEENNKLVHAKCHSAVYYTLAYSFRDAVVSNTFCTIDRMKPYFDIAKWAGTQVTVLHVQGRHGSVHDNVDQAYYEDQWEEYKGELH